MRVSTQRRAAPAVAALCLAAFLAPAQGAVPAALTGQVELRGSRSASVDVTLPRAVRVDDMFDTSRANFDSTRVGSGFALVGLDYAGYPPSLVGLLAPQGERGRRFLFPFGDDRRGNDVLDTQTLPAGRYRLYLVTTGAAVVRFRLPGLPGRRVFVPTRAEAVGARRVDASMRTSPAGEVLADTRENRAVQSMVVMTAAAVIKTAPRGYDSYACLYPGGPPAGGVYLPHCLNAPHGLGTGVHVPVVEVDYLGFTAFVNVDAGAVAASKSVEAPGQVVDQTSYFVWLPMPRGRPSPSEPTSTAVDGAAAGLTRVAGR